MNDTSMPAPRDEIDLRELFQTIWAGRWLIIWITAFFAVAAVTYSLLARPWYKAEIVLAPSTQQSMAGGALGGLSSLSRLAGLAGVNVANSGDTQAVAVLKSKDLAKDFIIDMKIQPALLAELKQGKRPLDIRDAVKVFDKKVRLVNEDSRTGLVTVSIRWRSADTAALWANTLARYLNDRLRTEAEKRAERNVAYLKNEIAGTSVVSLEQAIGSLLESEMQKLMLARSNQEFAFRVIDPAVVPISPDAPGLIIVLAASILAGGFVSILVLIVRRSVRAQPRQ